MLASAIAVVAVPPTSVTNARIWRPGRTVGLGISVPVVVAGYDNDCGRGRSRIAVPNARIWRPGRTLGLGITVPVVVAGCDNDCGRGRSRIAVPNAWIWSPGGTPGLSVTVPVVVTWCDNCGRRRSRIDWATAGNESSAGIARGVVPDHAAPRRAATQHANIGPCRHRTDDVVADARSAAQIEIVGECCCRDRARGKQHGGGGK